MSFQPGASTFRNAKIGFAILLIVLVFRFFTWMMN